MKSMLRTTLAIAVLAAFAASAHAQTPTKPAPPATDPKAAPTTPATPIAAPQTKPVDPKAAPGFGPKSATHFECPPVLQGAIQEQVKVPAPWHADKPTARNSFPLVESVLPRGEQGVGALTCKYESLDTTITTQLPKGCKPRLVGPWQGGDQVGTTRLPTKTPPPMTCKATAGGATGSAKGAPRCAIDCAITSKG